MQIHRFFELHPHRTKQEHEHEHKVKRQGQRKIKQTLFLTFGISHHPMTLTSICLGRPNHSLTERVSSWLMVFLSSGIFTCVQSRASISTLTLAQQCHCDFAESVPTSGPSILWCVYGQTNIMRCFSDLRGCIELDGESRGGRRSGRWTIVLEGVYWTQG